MGLLKEIAQQFEVVKNLPKINCTLFEDNNLCIALAKALRMNPWTKYIALKYHHFCGYVSSGLVNIKYIGTNEQTANIFTKALNKKQFLYLQKKLCGF